MIETAEHYLTHFGGSGAFLGNSQADVVGSPLARAVREDTLRYIEADQLRTPATRDLRQVVQRIADGMAPEMGSGDEGCFEHRFQEAS